MKVAVTGFKYAQRSDSETSSEIPRKTRPSLTTFNDIPTIAINIKHLFMDDFCKELFLILVSQNNTYGTFDRQRPNISPDLIQTITLFLLTFQDYASAQIEWFANFIIKSCENGLVQLAVEEWIKLYKVASQDTKVDFDPSAYAQKHVVLVPEMRDLYLSALAEVNFC